MGNLIADIFVTVKDRYALAARSLLSLLDNTDRSQFRLTVCVDGAFQHSADDYGLPSKLGDMQELRFILERHADYVLHSRENEGLGPTINRAVAHIKSINDWYMDPKAGDPDRVSPYIVMCQDDLLYSKNWLPNLASKFKAFEATHKLGFASGLECREHAVKKILVGHEIVSAEGRKGWSTGTILFKDWIRAAQMLGRREYWESLMPIPRFDPETGRTRAKPNDGMGSGVDWWLIRNHENSVCRTGRTCLVMPGLVQHAGYDKSTWLKRELPESDSDKERIRNG